MLKGEAVVVELATASNIDGFNANGFEQVEVENVLIEPESTAMLEEIPLQDSSFSAITAHFPKTFTKSLKGAKIHYQNRIYYVEGNPSAYPINSTPTSWNRSAYATTTNARN